MRAPLIAYAAAAVLALEGIALAGLAGREMIGLFSGEAAELPTALALTVLTLLGVLALLLFAVGVARGRSWARSGGVVLQVLAVALALASLTLTPVPWWFTAALGAPGLIGFALLIVTARIEGPVRPEEDGVGSSDPGASSAD